MALPTSKELRGLQGKRGGLHISIYTPLDHTSPESINSNQIRIKNIISELESILKSQDENSKYTHRVLKPLKQVLGSKAKLWQRHTKALAVFTDGKNLQYYFLPADCGEQQIIKSDSFYLHPIQSILADNREFYVLSTSYKHARLYKGDNFNLKPVNLKELPTDGAETALGIDEYPESLQFHAAEPVPSSNSKHGKSQQFHGQYNPKEVEKNILTQYFRKINQAVFRLLRKKNAPLVFAGVDYLFPIYKEVNSYGKLHPGSIEGNYQNARPEEIHKRALATIR